MGGENLPCTNRLSVLLNLQKIAFGNLLAIGNDHVFPTQRERERRGDGEGERGTHTHMALRFRF